MIAWAFAGGENTRFPSVEIGIKNQKFLLKFRLIDLILAMTVFFAGMRLTLHKSQVHSYSVMQW